MNPNFGVGIRDLLFEQVIDKEQVKNRITDGAQVYIPEVAQIIIYAVMAITLLLKPKGLYGR